MKEVATYIRIDRFGDTIRMYVGSNDWPHTEKWLNALKGLVCVSFSENPNDGFRMEKGIVEIHVGIWGEGRAHLFYGHVIQLQQSYTYTIE